MAAEKSPFLTERLRIWMLPTVAIVKQEKVEDYVVGFDELGGSDNFKLEILEERISRVGGIFPDSINKPAVQEKNTSVRKGFTLRTASDEDSDFD